jgi:hypothetical protein
MRLKNYTMIIDDNNKKYDIFKVVKIDDNLTVCVTKKRFLNIFKKPILFEDEIRFMNLSSYIDSYIHSSTKKSYYSFIEDINKKYFLFGYHINELIVHEKLNEILESYKIINVLTE